MKQIMHVVFNIENDTNERTNIAYYLYNGVGRTTPMFIAQAILRIYRRPFRQSILDAAMNVGNCDADLMTNERIGDGFEEDLQKYNFNNIEQTNEWFCSRTENNNGGAVVSIKYTKGTEHIDKFSVSFLKGSEDCEAEEKPFSRYLSFEEYKQIPMNIAFGDIYFYAIFNDMMTYFCGK